MTKEQRDAHLKTIATIVGISLVFFLLLVIPYVLPVLLIALIAICIYAPIYYFFADEREPWL